MNTPADQNPTDETTLEVADLGVDVLTENGWATVVDSVSFSVRRGETLGLVGESGSGKSVTCLSITGLMPPAASRVRAEALTLLGRDLTALQPRELADVRGPQIGMIFQEPMSSLNPAFTVGDQIAEVLRRHERMPRRAAAARAVALLDRVGVPSPARRARQYPFEFSGGMRQRVMIAIALAGDPDVIIADEPTTALDVTVQAQILELLRELQRERGMSVIVITHDLGVVADVCDRVLVMYAGRIVESAPVHELFQTPRHPYTAGLLAAMPRMDRPVTALSTIPGAPPRVGAFPAGCPFRPRCSHAIEACRAEPPLEPVAPGRTTRCLRHPELTLRGTT